MSLFQYWSYFPCLATAAATLPPSSPRREEGEEGGGGVGFFLLLLLLLLSPIPLGLLWCEEGRTPTPGLGDDESTTSLLPPPPHDGLCGVRNQLCMLFIFSLLSGTRSPLIVYILYLDRLDFDFSPIFPS